MYGKVGRYKINFVSTHGKKFHFTVLALSRASALTKAINYFSKKMDKEVEAVDNDLLIDGTKVASIVSVERILRKEK